MSRNPIERCIRDSLDAYYRGLDGGDPSNVYDMVLQVIERPLLETAMEWVSNNQSQAADHLGINRNTLRRKLQQHGLIRGCRPAFEPIFLLTAPLASSANPAPHPPTGISTMTQQALLSVSDKTDTVDFARALRERGVKLLSAGGTAKLFVESSLPVTEAADYTGFPETLGGRIKTLHPKVHGGILARRDLPEHMAVLSEHNTPTIDLLVVNLYPFQQTTAKDECSLAGAIESIDIDGPTMLYSAAKNHRDVTVVADPADYAIVLVEM